MTTTEQSYSTEELIRELESLVTFLDHVGSKISTVCYNAKTYDQKNVTVENNRILGLPVFTYEIALSERFDPKKHFKQFQQFSEGAWRDYALLLLTDDSIGLLDLEAKEIVATLNSGFAVNEIHVENVNVGFSGIEKLLKRGKEIIEDCSEGDLEHPCDLDGTVQFLGSALRGIMHRSGRTGFYSVASTDSALRPEVMLHKLDLSKNSRRLLEEISIEPIRLAEGVPLHEAVTMDLTTEHGFIVLEKIYRRF